jgi:DNA-binding NarL/FixJ family response regulator
VLDLLAQGLANKHIATRLAISEHTAKFHVNAILQKLGARGRTEAVVRAAHLGLVAL